MAQNERDSRDRAISEGGQQPADGSNIGHIHHHLGNKLFLNLLLNSELQKFFHLIATVFD